MYPDPIDYESLQRRVTMRVQRRYRFFFHSAIFVLGIPVVGGWGSPLWFLLWVGAWVGHWLWMNYQNNLEQEIEREIEAERARVVKRKRDYADLYDPHAEEYEYEDDGRRDIWLGNDGELEFDDRYP